jgi:thiopeptide-type bacteriocin biosynthesis protein
VKTQAHYRAAGVAMWRSSSVGAVPSGRWPHADDGYTQWINWIQQVWAIPGVEEAIALASPVLARRVEAAIAGGPTFADIQRVAKSIARYLVRMRGRATPFGLFAGVAPLRFGAATAMALDEPECARLRANGEWLATVAARIERMPEALAQLSVVANDSVVIRGDRLHVAWQPHLRDPALPRVADVSMRCTAQVLFALRAAQQPVSVGDLAAEVAAEFPPAPIRKAEGLVSELVAAGALITNLRPPMTTVDALGHLVRVLSAIDLGNVPALQTLTGDLQQIHQRLEASATTVIDGAGRVQLADQMHAVAACGGQPLAVDLRMGGDRTLPRRVADEIASGVGTLMRLAGNRSGLPSWREYHSRFLERYGVGALVPVSDLVDEALGLGYPRHFTTKRPEPALELTPRDERLLALAQRAAMEGAIEVALTDADLAALSGEDSDTVRLPASLDVIAEVRASSREALDQGDFRIALSGVGRNAVATSARFFDLLPGHADEVLPALSTTVQEALLAQLSFPPHKPSMEPVARVAPILPLIIPIAEHRPTEPDHLLLRDLAVTADLDRMYVISVSRRRVVEPVLVCAAAAHTMPPVARLLMELPHARNVPRGKFDWGIAHCLPFQPRLTHERTILSPARWTINADALPGRDVTAVQWRTRFAQLRQELRLPKAVIVGVSDQRLCLALDEPMDMTLLRDHLDRTSGPITITEAPEASDHGWCDGYAHEIVVPLTVNSPATPTPAVVARAAQGPLLAPDHGQLPGGDMLFAKLYGPADAVDVVLTDRLPQLLEHWDDTPAWWYVRYRDPQPHLRLRIPTADYGAAVAQLRLWASDLRASGLIGDLTLDTYRPETARYGRGAAMRAAEQLFAADSVAAVAQLTAVAQDPAAANVLTAVSLFELVEGMLGSRDAAAKWFLDRPTLHPRRSAPDRAVLRRTVALASPTSDRAELSLLPNSGQITAAWVARRTAIRQYQQCLDEPVGPSPSIVAGSLLHMHHNRMLGIGSDRESEVFHLARAIALAVGARRPQMAGASS